MSRFDTDPTQYIPEATIKPMDNPQNPLLDKGVNEIATFKMTHTTILKVTYVILATNACYVLLLIPRVILDKWKL